MRVKVVVIILAAVAAMGAVPTAGSAREHECPQFRANGVSFNAIVLRGRPRCPVVDRVLRIFMSGGGRMHGPPNGPAYRQSWTVEGWRCGHGTGGGACIRGGRTYRTAREWIEAQAA